MSQKLKRILAIAGVVFILLFFTSLVFIFGASPFLKAQMPALATVFGIIGFGLWALVKFDGMKGNDSGKYTKSFNDEVQKGAENFEKEIEEGKAVAEDDDGSMAYAAEKETAADNDASANNAENKPESEKK